MDLLQEKVSTENAFKFSGYVCVVHVERKKSQTREEISSWTLLGSWHGRSTYLSSPSFQIAFPHKPHRANIGFQKILGERTAREDDRPRPQTAPDFLVALALLIPIETPTSSIHLPLPLDLSC